MSASATHPDWCVLYDCSFCDFGGNHVAEASEIMASPDDDAVVRVRRGLYDDQTSEPALPLVQLEVESLAFVGVKASTWLSPVRAIQVARTLLEAAEKGLS